MLQQNTIRFVIFGAVLLVVLYIYYSRCGAYLWTYVPVVPTFCWNQPIVFSTSGDYELLPCFRKLEGHIQNPEEEATIEEGKIRVNGSNRSLTFSELADIPDKEWLENFDRSVYHLYPLSVNLSELIWNVTHGQLLKTEPVYNPKVRFLKVPSYACSPKKAVHSQAKRKENIVIVYKSGVYNLQQRTKLRRLYRDIKMNNVPIELVFSIGTPRTSQSDVFQRDGFNVTLRNRAGSILRNYLKSLPETQEKIEREMRAYNDLLIGDYEDSYFNLTLKMFHTYQWAARFCRLLQPTFVFIDDDYAVNTEQLVKYVRSYIRDHEGLGYRWERNPVQRPNRWNRGNALSKREVPWPEHVPEHWGMYSVWGYKAVRDVALGMYFTKPIPIDDVWIGTIQVKLGHTFKILPDMFFGDPSPQKFPNCSQLFFASVEAFESRSCLLR